MVFEKVDDDSFKETRQVDTIYRVLDLKRQISMIDMQITSFHARRKRLEDLLAEGEKVGVKIVEAIQ